MANLGDFFELVFAAKVYQRLNPENCSINIRKGNVIETYNKNILDGEKIKEFLLEKIKNKKIVGKQMWLVLHSKEIKYNNEEIINDTLKSTLLIRSNITNLNNFITLYENPKKIEKDHIDDLLKNLKEIPSENKTKRVKYAIDTGIIFKQDEKWQYDLTKSTDPDIRKSRSIKSILKNIEYVNIQNKINDRKKNFNKILSYNIEVVPEIKSIIRLRNKYLADKIKQNLSFNIHMMGEIREEGKKTQGKTDIKIDFIVNYTENNIKKENIHIFRISLKYDSDRIHTANSRTLQILNEMLSVQELSDEINKENLKRLITNFIFDNITTNDSQSLIKFTGKNTLYLNKNKLINVLNKLDYNKFKKHIIDSNNFIILYDEIKFLKISKNMSSKKTSYNIETLDYFKKILELK